MDGKKTTVVCLFKNFLNRRVTIGSLVQYRFKPTEYERNPAGYQIGLSISTITLQGYCAATTSICLKNNCSMKILFKKSSAGYFFLAALMGLPMLLHWQCKKDEPSDCPVYSDAAVITINPTAQAGAVFGQLDYFNADYYNTYLVDEGWSITDISSVTLYSLHIDLQTSTSGVSFADFDTAEIILDGLSVGTIPAGTTGSRFSLWPNKDVKFAYTNPDPGRVHTLSFQGVTNKAIPSVNVLIQFSVLTCLK